MTLVLDSGALIAYERGSRVVQAYLKRAARSGSDVRTTTAAVAQVWRDGRRQVSLSRLLHGVDEAELTKERARRIGDLLRLAALIDVVDGSIVEASHDGDEILTSDPDDLLTLASAASRTLIITALS